MNTNSYFASKNSNWKGSPRNITKRALHYRVTAKRGKASEHKCAHCGKPADDWAEIHGKPGQYKPLCKKHHSIYDKFCDHINKKGRKKLHEELLEIARNIK